ncbi:MAG: (d)CMP kinase [Candidatus Omnitrophica bacterium]|nr:(d)CMP kinase [Candidatus Omnitrophota bacterium]
MKKVSLIAIDGPAGSGKSTVAREVAKRLGFLYIDTGAIYRALTLKAINEGLDFGDKEALIALSQRTDIELEDSSDFLKVYLDKKDVSEKIRMMEVSRKVKIVAALKGVRDNMVKLQRRLGRTSSGAVLEGRDIGTVVFPDAAHKFYLDATFETRAKRRFDELKKKGFGISLEEIKNDVETRDKTDMTRKVAPLKKAKDAIAIDTTNMTVEEVTKKVLWIVKSQR